MVNRKAQGEVKTSLYVPEDVWKRAKIRALEERRDLREVILAALESYLCEEKGESK